MLPPVVTAALAWFKELIVNVVGVGTLKT